MSKGDNAVQFHWLKYYKGHTVFKVDKETLEISKAEISKEPMKDNKGNPVKGLKIIMEDGFIYVSALNELNVKRKLVKMGVAVRID